MAVVAFLGIVVEIVEFHLIRRSPTHASVDIPVVRDNLEGMAFPLFK